MPLWTQKIKKWSRKGKKTGPTAVAGETTATAEATAGAELGKTVSRVVQRIVQTNRSANRSVESFGRVLPRVT